MLFGECRCFSYSVYFVGSGTANCFRLTSVWSRNLTNYDLFQFYVNSHLDSPSSDVDNNIF